MVMSISHVDLCANKAVSTEKHQIVLIMAAQRDVSVQITPCLIIEVIAFPNPNVLVKITAWFMRITRYFTKKAAKYGK